VCGDFGRQHFLYISPDSGYITSPSYEIKLKTGFIYFFPLFYATINNNL